VIGNLAALGSSQIFLVTVRRDCTDGTLLCRRTPQAKKTWAAPTETASAATGKLPRDLLGEVVTVKLRGRPEAPIKRRGGTLSSRARGDTTVPHGTLQRLLGGGVRRVCYLSCTQTYLILSGCLRGVTVCIHFCPACSQSPSDSNPGTLAIVE
jgi:hypothetical protein